MKAGIHEDLVALLRCHSTPGDERDVRSFLMDQWKASGLTVQRYGDYAIAAHIPGTLSEDKPILLICAHMDSPGYIVETIHDGEIRLIPLGSPRFEGTGVDGILKTHSGYKPIRIIKKDDTSVKDVYVAKVKHTNCVSYGDRACFVSNPRLKSNQRIICSPFLDNRLGCYLLCDLVRSGLLQESLPFSVVLGATACEEMGGFGAPVLASSIKPPSFVICLDATYENKEQSVEMGAGPVLTLSDASCLLSSSRRDRIQAFFNAQLIPLQTEVYNVSATDARAFPSVGLSALILPLLIVTQGNHSPEETAALEDVIYCRNALAALTREGIDLLSI